MKVFNLQDDIFPDKKLPGSSIIIYHYTSHSDSLKEKSVLHRNAFSLVITGHKTMHFAEKTVYVHDTEIHILSAGNCIASVSIPEQTIFESVLIFFDNEVLSDFYSTYSDLIDRLKKNRNINAEQYVAFKKDNFIKNYIQSLLLALNKNGQLSEPMKQLKLQELLLYLLENHTDVFLSFKHSGELSNIEMRIKKVVEANRSNNLTLDELSFLSNVSVSTFKRHFKKIYNNTPGVWLNEQRMILARKMLSEQHEKPAEIWFRLGFETHTGFTKSFKKHFGKLPKEFARKLT